MGSHSGSFELLLKVALALFDTLLVTDVLHATSALLPPSRGDCQIVMVDSREEAESSVMFDGFCSYPRIHVSELAGLCIEHGIWPISGPGGNLFLNQWEPEPCEQVGTYKAFGQFIVQNLGITAKRPRIESDNPVQVLWVVRKGTRKVVNMTDIVRSVSCTQPEALVLEPSFDPNVNPWPLTKPRVVLPKCEPRSDADMRLIYLEDHAMERQIAAVRSAHVIITAHGAGEFTYLFANVPTICVEIQPHVGENWIYRNLAKKWGTRISASRLIASKARISLKGKTTNK